MKNKGASVLEYINTLIERKELKSQSTEDIELFASRIKILFEHVPTAVYVLSFEEGRYLFFSDYVAKLSGFTAQELIQNGISWVVSRVHPDDTQIYSTKVFSRFLEVAKSVSDNDLPNTRFEYNWRFRKKDNNYIHVLQQYTIIKRDELNNPLVSIGVLTDISHLKSDGSIIFSVTNHSPIDGQERILFQDKFSMNSFALSLRELEVVRFICQGETSKTIGAKLNISEYTVRAHRRKIFEKMEVRNMAELCRKALDQGLIPPNDAISS